jgi:Carboxypeptidase regulatory-like domain
MAGLLILTAAQFLWCSATGSISGVVHDTSGAVVPGAAVIALNAGTGVKRTVETDVRGFYSFQALPVGTYEVNVTKTGFYRYRQTGLVLDVNSDLVVDVLLKLGEIRQEVSVASTAVHVDTRSTEIGDVITGTTITAMPLNGRSYVDLLALQPGVASENSIQGDPEFGGVSAYGETSAPFQSSSFSAAGNLSMNGNQETSNAFMVNGALVDDVVQQGTTVVPNLDSVAEFRILTNGYQAEYGNYGGGQINVVTKSGTNKFHGDAFDFVRNTSFDARNFFSPTIGAYHQNQFGGTFGGPILHNKLFFFGDYQGTRYVTGVDTGDVAVPSLQERNGDLSGEASSLTGTVNGAGWAGVLSQELGYPVTDGEPYYTSGCASSAQCVFPGAIIPQRAVSTPASKFMGYIPLPNVSGNFFSTSGNNETFDDNEEALRMDGNTKLGMLSGYYYFDRNSLDNPYPQEDIPGFSGLGGQQAQLATFGDTKTLGSTKVNELHLNFLRVYNSYWDPVGGVGPSVSSFGITEGCETLGVCVLAPQYQGVPRVDFNEFSIGVNSHTGTFVQNTFEGIDNFSKVWGTHTLMFGGETHFDQLTEYLISRPNGDFSFNGAETGLDFGDFLIGAPAEYQQGESLPGYNRSRYYGLYAQDTWRAAADVSVNYGVRWDVSYPWY